MSAPKTAPSLAEHVCLALVGQGVSHGWALGTLLAHDGEIGRVWSLSRPLTYRAVDGLLAKKLLARRGQRAGEGADRVLLTVTASGRRANEQWLEQPVAHLREVRTELLVKLVLCGRAGLDVGPLLAAQRLTLAPTVDSLLTVHGDDLVDRWRRESARAVQRFLDGALQGGGEVAAPRPELRLSARNQLRGIVTAVRHGEVMSTVKAVLGDGQPLTAAITREGAEELDLVVGDPIVMIVKSTEVMVALPA